MLDFSDRTAIVTGAGRGIGRATALTLAECGANVVVADVADERDETATTIEEAGGRALAVEVDVTDRDAIERAVGATLAEFDGVDVLVNNAGIFPTYEFGEMTLEQWQRVIDVNLTGAFNCTQAVLPAMRERGYGRIVNVASVAGGRIGWSGDLSHYAASKGGMVGFTRSAAIALAPDGITMNAILPGAIDTGGADRESAAEQMEAIAAMTPVGRQGEPEEIAFLLAVLASERAGFVTGATLVADGGITLV